MMDAPMWFLVLFALVFLAFGLPYLLTWSNLAFTRLRPMKCRAVADVDLPEGLMLAAQELRGRLEELGFEYKGAMATSSLLFDLEGEFYSLAFVHSEYGTLASVTETAYPGASRMFEVAFYNRLVNDRVLHTMDCFRHQMFSLPKNYILQDGYSGDLEQQWRLHKAQLNHNPAVTDEWSVAPFVSTQLDIAHWLQQSADDFFAYWRQKRIVLRLAVDVYFPNPIYLLQFVPRLIRGQKSVIQLLQHLSTPSSPAKPRFFLERQLAFQRGSNTVSKVLLLIVSLAVFYLAFGLVFSWTLVPMLVVILFIHEYGHYLAMRICGYRNTQIFFLPLLGAVTTGQKSDPTLRQELLVYLAGPIPGIVLSIGLLLSPLTAHWQWLVEFAVLCFVLNFINLLPLVPLDGGRVVEKLLFTRYAGARFAFYALSALGFALAAWFSRDFLLALLAVVTAVLAKNDWHKRKVLRRILARVENFFDRAPQEKRELILAQLCEENLPATQRFLFAKDFMTTHSVATPSIKTALLGTTLYIGILAASVASGFYWFSQNGIRLNDDYDEDAYYSAPYWRKAIKEEKEYGASGWQSLLGAIEALQNGPNPEDAQEFITLAQAHIRLLAEPNLQLAQWRLLKPDLTGIPLVAEDVVYIQHNIRQGSEPEYEKAHVLMNLLDARSLLKDTEKLAIVTEALDLLQSAQDSDAYTAATLFYRKGKLEREIGLQTDARKSFESGFEFEVAGEYAMFSDANYQQLVDIYFAAEEYSAALTLADARLAAITGQEGATRDMLDGYLEDVRQQQAWFLLLTGAAGASDAFASLLEDYAKRDEVKLKYDKESIEHILDALHSHRVQERDATPFEQRVQQLPREHIEKFIRGCNCQNRGPFDTYRHDQYLEILEQLGLAKP